MTGLFDHAAAASGTSRGDRGILIWNDGNGSNPTAEVDLLGGTDLNIGGKIYSPKELVKVDGGEAAANAAVQIIAWTSMSVAPRGSMFHATRTVSSMSTVTVRVSFGRFGTSGGWHGPACGRNIARMLKRVAAAFLWYAMVWIGYEIAWSVAGLPRLLGPILAASVAMIVVVDPLHLLWPRPEVTSDTHVGLGVPGLDATAASRP